MRFLCLHGLGTNADIFETQTGPFIEEIGNGHEFEFFDGDYEFFAAPGIGEIFPGPYFSWHPLPNTPTNIKRGIEDIKDLIVKNGPFDGAMGFSQGAQMVMGLMMEHQLLHPYDPPLFEVAVFFNGGLNAEQKVLAAKGFKLRVPTAHILGGKKDVMYKDSMAMRDACEKGLRVEYEHDEGHTIPRKTDLVIEISRLIKRSIDRAIYKS